MCSREDDPTQHDIEPWHGIPAPTNFHVDRYLKWLAGLYVPPPTRIAYCDSCGEVLTPVFPDLNRRKTDCQYNNALVIDFTGGYGMFDDDIPNLTKQAILCHDCAHKLIAENLWIRHFVDDRAGHMHEHKAHS